MTSDTVTPHAVITAYDRLRDGLYTYCLSVLCERDAAVAALDEVRALALANGERLADTGLRRAWLYSLARYACLRRLAAGTAGGGSGGAAGGVDSGIDSASAPADLAGRRRELAALAWPEAAGTSAEQREALELSARHRLTPLEVAAVLGLAAEPAQRLLVTGAAEVARTRRALLVLAVGSCPELARLGGAGAEHWREWVLGPALRRELLRHVQECPTCRGTAERVGDELGGPLELGAPLALLPAPMPAPPKRGAGAGAFLAGAGAGRHATAGADDESASAVTNAVTSTAASAAARTAARTATSTAARTRDSGRGAGKDGGNEAVGRVRFDQRGFPRHRAPSLLERHRPGGDLHERAVLVRQRALATGVLAAVLSAPPAALWVAHQNGSPAAGTAAAVSSVRVDSLPGSPDTSGPSTVPVAPIPALGAGQGPGAAPERPLGRPLGPGSGRGLAAALVGSSTAGAETLLPAVQGVAVPVPGIGGIPLGSPDLHPEPVPPSSAPATGARLAVEAGAYGNRTVLTLTNTGDAPLDWRAVPSCDWLRLSRDSGTLAPGQRLTVTVTVDDQRAPSQHWTAQIALPPSEAVVRLEGGPDRPGEPSGTPTPTPSASPTGTPSASANPSGSASPTPSETPSSGSSASNAPSSSASPSASPTSGPSASGSASASARPSSPPSTVPTPSGPTATSAPTSAKSTSNPSSSSPVR